MNEELDNASKAYADLLKTSGTDRVLYVQRALSYLRDRIAELTGLAPEDVQNRFEQAEIERQRYGIEKLPDLKPGEPT